MNVVGFRPRIDETVIAALESMLALAKRGDLDSVAIAATHSDSSFTTSYSADINPHALLGAIEVLKLRVQSQVEIDD